MQLTTTNWAARRLLNSVHAVNKELNSASVIPEGPTNRKSLRESRRYPDDLGNTHVSIDSADLHYDSKNQEVYHQSGRLMLHDVEHDVEYAKSGSTEVYTSKINQNQAFSVINTGKEQLLCDERNGIVAREPKEDLALSAGEQTDKFPEHKVNHPRVSVRGWDSRSVEVTYERPVQGQSFLGTIEHPGGSEDAVISRQPLLDMGNQPKMALVTHKVELTAPKVKAVGDIITKTGLGAAIGTIAGGLLEHFCQVPGATGIGLALGTSLGAGVAAPSAYKTYHSTNELTWEDRAIEVNQLAGTKEVAPGVNGPILDKKIIGSYLAPKTKF